MYTLQPQLKPARAASFPIWPILFATILVIAGGFVGLLILRQSVPQSANTASDFDACWMAQKFVEEQLKSPYTATFAPCRTPDTVVTTKERIWIVRSYVDAQNGFGAMLRTDYAVEMIYYPSTDKWALVDSSLASR